MRRILAASALTMSLFACTLASPTYITAETATDPDGGAATSTSNDTSKPASTSAGTATCGTSDFVKPDVSTLTACGNGKGHCFDKTKTDLASLFTACPDASQVCVPDEVLEADGGKLKSCTSVIGAGGCVNAGLIPSIAANGGGALKQDVCDAGQTCVPCTDPTHGNAPTPFCLATGVHQNACSTATSAADAGPPAAACCTTGGKSSGVCIADSAIPADQQSSTSQLECSSGNKCVPAAFVSNTPVHCKAGNVLGKGVCLDKCFSGTLDTVSSVGLLDRDVCGATEVCIPCAFAPSATPGCQ